MRVCQNSTAHSVPPSELVSPFFFKLRGGCYNLHIVYRALSIAHSVKSFLLRLRLRMQCTVG